MNSSEFKYFRKKLNKTQKEMAHLLGVSLKAVRSYEQGWRSIPEYIVREIFFLVYEKVEIIQPSAPCWIVKNCKDNKKERCPAWEYHSGTLCWFLNGTICDKGTPISWGEKIQICQNCSVFPNCLKSNIFES